MKKPEFQREDAAALEAYAERQLKDGALLSGNDALGHAARLHSEARHPMTCWRCKAPAIGLQPQAPHKGLKPVCPVHKSNRKDITFLPLIIK